MNRVIRTFLLWLLALALPVQGIAAAINQSCGPTHHHGSAELAAQHHHSNSSEDVTRHAQGHDADIADSNTTIDMSAPATDTQLSASKCSACAACCVGAVAPPAALNWTPPHHGSIAVVVAPASPFSGYFPERLKRPPRYSFV